MKKVYQMMRDYREKRGITQTHVAKQAGINPKRISQLETGLVRLTADATPERGCAERSPRRRPEGVLRMQR